MNSGRLFMLQLARSKAAREDALSTLRKEPNGWWSVQIGGRQKGRRRSFPSHQSAEDAVNEHYNAALFKAVTQTRRQLTVRAKEGRIKE